MNGYSQAFLHMHCTVHVRARKGSCILRSHSKATSAFRYAHGPNMPGRTGLVCVWRGGGQVCGAIPTGCTIPATSAQQTYMYLSPPPSLSCAGRAYWPRYSCCKATVQGIGALQGLRVAADKSHRELVAPKRKFSLRQSHKYILHSSM